MSTPMWDIPDRADGLCWACGSNPVGDGLVDMCRPCVDDLGTQPSGDPVDDDDDDDVFCVDPANHPPHVVDPDRKLRDVRDLLRDVYRVLGDRGHWADEPLFDRIGDALDLIADLITDEADR